MLKAIKQFIRDEEGATAIEYGLIIGLIAVLLVGVLLIMGPKLSAIFTEVSDALPAAGD